MKSIKWILLCLVMVFVSNLFTWRETANHITRKVSDNELSAFRLWNNLSESDKAAYARWPQEKESFLNWQLISDNEKSSFHQWNKLTQTNKQAIESWSTLSEADKLSFAKWQTLSAEKKEKLASTEKSWMKIATKCEEDEPIPETAEVINYFTSRGAILKPLKEANIIIQSNDREWDMNMVNTRNYYYSLTIKYKGQTVASTREHNTTENVAFNLAQSAFQAITDSHNNEVIASVQ